MDRIWFRILFSLVPVGMGLVTMFVAGDAKDVTLSIFGLGILIIGATAMILVKLNDLIDAVRSSGEDVETVLKQRLH